MQRVLINDRETPLNLRNCSLQCIYYCSSFERNIVRAIHGRVWRNKMNRDRKFLFIAQLSVVNKSVISSYMWEDNNSYRNKSRLESFIMSP